MKKYYLILFLILSVLPVLSADYVYAGLEPISRQYSRSSMELHSKDLQKLNYFEKKLFGRIFYGESIGNRIARLEEKLLGSIQSGDLRSRYENISNVFSNYYKIRTSSAIPTNNVLKWQGLAGSLGNFFSGGYPTGITPQVYPSFYSPDYQYGYYSNRGWRYNDIYRGSGVGVKILD